MNTLLLAATSLLLFLSACQRHNAASRASIAGTDSTTTQAVYGLSPFIGGYARITESYADSAHFYIDEYGMKVPETEVKRMVSLDTYDAIVHGEKLKPQAEQIRHAHPGHPLGYIDLQDFRGRDSILLTTRHGMSMWAKKGMEYENPQMQGETLTTFKYGFVRADGTAICAVEYDYYDAYVLSTDGFGDPDYFQFFITDKYLKLVRQDKDGVLKMGLADHDGHIIMPVEYDMLYPFTFEKADYIGYRKGGNLYTYNYIAVVRHQSDNQHPRFGVADDAGQTIIPPVMGDIAQEVRKPARDEFTHLTWPFLGYDTEEKHWVYYTKEGKKLPYRGEVTTGWR